MTRIVLVAGEASGDLLGGKLASALKEKNIDINLSGIGGNNMRASGVETLFDINETSVVGIIEILKHYPRLRSILSSVKRHIKNNKPDLLILIDYPEFNLKLATYAKTLGIKVLFYVSPQLWAWRTGRVKKIKRCVDLMAVLFPFEVDFYQQHQIPVCLVRHPVLDEIDNATNNSADPHTIGLLPGSRNNEIKKLLPVMQEAAQLLKPKFPQLKFLIPVAANLDVEELRQLQTRELDVEYSQDNFYLAIQRCQAVAIASGTATLQCALLGKPMVIIYKISPLTYHFFGHLIKVDHIGLPNIILGRRAFVELIQSQASAEQLSQELEKILEDKSLAEKMETTKKELYAKLYSGISSKQLAEQALQLID